VLHAFQAGWFRDRRGFQRASKQDLMTVLQKVEFILIKSRYFAQQQEARLAMSYLVSWNDIILLCSIELKNTNYIPGCSVHHETCN
jgi:Laminin B (Domain IV)